MDHPQFLKKVISLYVSYKADFTIQADLQFPHTILEILTLFSKLYQPALLSKSHFTATNFNINDDWKSHPL